MVSPVGWASTGVEQMQELVVAATAIERRSLCRCGVVGRLGVVVMIGPMKRRVWLIRTKV